MVQGICGQNPTFFVQEGIAWYDERMFLNHDDDAVGNAPEIHKAVFENETIRVLDVVVPPRHKTLPHWHPNNIGYVLSPGRLRFTLTDGTVRDAELSVGQVTHGSGEHIVENVGGSEVRVIQIEFKG